MTAASTVIAGVAIVGGYLGVRSANRNAVEIAREERSAQRQSEVNALKREVYGKFFVALTTFMDAKIALLSEGTHEESVDGQIRARANEARSALALLVSQVELIGGEQVRKLVKSAFGHALAAKDRETLVKGSVKGIDLLAAMRADLETDLSGSARARQRSSAN